MCYVLFLLALAIQFIHTAEITGVSTTVLYDSTGAEVSCLLPTGTFTKAVWKTGGSEITSEDATYVKTDNADKNSSKLVVKNTAKEDTEYTCVLTVSDVQETASTTVYVTNIAGISAPICKEECTITCVLAPLQQAPTSVYWQTTSKKPIGTNANFTMPDGAVLQHRDTEFLYSSRETTLLISNLTATNYFTCVFKSNAEQHKYLIEHRVSALIRPTKWCDIASTCTTKADCHSTRVVEDETCRNECASCFKYQYNEGDFLKSGQCKADHDMCKKYLGTVKECTDKTLIYDPIATYCELCGYCLELEFKPVKLILPVIFIVALVLLTILMCYKSYDEKRSILPKVQVTNTDPGKTEPPKKDKDYVPSVVTSNAAVALPEVFRLKVKSKASHSNGTETKPSSQTV